MRGGVRAPSSAQIDQCRTCDTPERMLPDLLALKGIRFNCVPGRLELRHRPCCGRRSPEPRRAGYIRLMADAFQLWGTFSVADHKRRNAFIADVLVYDRLVIPVPAGDDGDERWARNNWNVEEQAAALQVLREGNPNRVVAIPWDSDKRDRYQERTDTLARSVAGDVKIVDQVARDNPDTPAQWVTREVLRDAVNAQNDARLLGEMMDGLPDLDVQVVAAYPSLTRLTAETGIAPVTARQVTGADLLGGFAWPFLLPAEPGRTKLDLLKRAVEFANQPVLTNYRQAYHRWRAEVVVAGKTPAEAAAEMTDQIAAYGEWAQRQSVHTRVHTACTVVALAVTVAGSAVLPFIGVPALIGTSVSVAGAGTSLVEFINTGVFRRRGHAAGEPTALGLNPGALFWKAQRALA